MKKYNQSGYRNMRTTQEKRMYYAHKDLVHIRGRRRAHNIVDVYDDIYTTTQKTWKHKRKKQYHNRSEMKRYVVTLDRNYIGEYWLEKFFSKHNIPFKLTEIKKKVVQYLDEVVRVKHKYVPYYTYAYGNKKPHQAGWQWIYINVKTGKKKKYCYSYTEYYVLEFWSNKNIDVEKLIYESAI